MSQHYILAIDQGTTSSRCILFNSDGELVESSQQEITSFYPQEGWVEQDPEEIYQSVKATFDECLKKAGITAGQISGIGITNQRETTVVWDRNSGKPVYPAIVWQSRQSLPVIETWKSRGLEPLIREKTGLVADAYFSAGKLAWILENHPAVRQQALNGELAFGTVDS